MMRGSLGTCSSYGTVWSWGLNNWGQLGDGTTTDRLTAKVVPHLDSVVSIAAGYGHSLGLKSDGTVWAWGENGGALGNGSAVALSRGSGFVPLSSLRHARLSPRGPFAFTLRRR